MNILLILSFILGNILPYVPKGSEGETQILNSYDTVNVEIYNNIKQYHSSKDTLSIVKSYLLLSDNYKNQQLYSLSFDFLWQALELSDRIGDKSTQAKINHDLGVLYNIFNKHKDALTFFSKAIELKEDIIKREVGNKEILCVEYFSVAHTYYKLSDFNKAFEFLDKSDTILRNTKSPTSTLYNDVQRGIIYMAKGEIEKAENLIYSTLPTFEKRKSHYLVMMYMYLGNLYEIKKDKNQAIVYYKKSLAAIEKYASHIDMEQAVLERLAHLYYTQNKPQLAFNYLKRCKEITDRIYNPQGIINSQIFQIRNKYEENIELKNKQIQQRETEFAEKEISAMRFSIFIITILALLSISFILYWFKNRIRRKEYKIQKESEKNDEIIKIKNRELTSFTLQIIDKENIIADLCSLLKENEVGQAKVNSILAKDNNIWEEFNRRFLEVNTEFYNTLSLSYPKLTATELKHCALIKLNFSSKEMSRLLNISTESIHISRHRIRKKLGLTRDENLASFMSQLG